MSSILSPGPRPSKAYHAFWRAVFVVGLLTVFGLLYMATKEVDYVWRWYRVPQYFFYEDTVEIRADIEGEVESVELFPGGGGVVVVEGYDGETERYEVPEGQLDVADNDLISPGDVLGSYKQWEVGLLLQGLWITLEISVLSILLGTVIGLFTGLARLSVNPALRWSAMTYVELIRGSPLLVQIFIWYFVIGTVINTLLRQQGLPEISAFWFGVASLAFFAGAYIGEIVRAGIQSIHRGQMEAAKSLGMNQFQAMRHIILPQAFKRILPPLAGQFISLIKDSSLLGLIAIRELTKATREVVTVSLQPFELWFMCAILYLLLTFAFSLFTQYLERRSA